MTAGEPPADDGNGSPAIGPNIEGDKNYARAHMGGERGGVPESSAVRGTRAGIILPLKSKVEKSPGALSQV